MVSKPPFGHLHPAPCLTQKSFSFSSCVPCTGTNLSPKSPLFTNQHQKQAQRLLMCQTMESATHRNSPHVSPVFHVLFWSITDCTNGLRSCQSIKHRNPPPPRFVHVLTRATMHSNMLLCSSACHLCLPAIFSHADQSGSAPSIQPGWVPRLRVCSL